jgi:hypothetical protein
MSYKIWFSMNYSTSNRKTDCFKRNVMHVMTKSLEITSTLEHSLSHFCYTPLITRGSVGRVHLVEWRVTEV